MLLIRYSDPRGIEEPAALTSLGSNVRFGELTLTNGAAVGDVTNSTIALDDQAGALDIQGLRAFDVRELSAPSNNRVIYRGVVQDRVVSRSAEKSALTTTARLWSVDLSDYNWHIWKRVLVDSDANRPAETVGDRLRWLMQRAAHINLNDYGHVTYPSRQLEPNDYRRQKAGDVLNDCCIEDQYNFWADFNEAHGRPELFFLDPASTDYPASIATSNVHTDVDGNQVFFPSTDATLTRSPSRIAFGALVDHPNGFEYRRKDSTGEQFGKLDQVAPMANVKSAARAGRLAQRFVNDNDEEDDVLEWDLILPAAQVNDARHGQIMPVKFQHLPGYEDWVGVRILERTVIQDPELGSLVYRVHYKASFARNNFEPADTPFTGSAISALIGWASSSNPAITDEESFAMTGDLVGGGYAGLPTIGPLTPVDGFEPDFGITAERDMVVRISAEVWAEGVVSAAESASLRILLNGSPIDSVTHSDLWLGGAHAISRQFVVNAYNVSLVAGDVVSMDTTVENDGFFGSFGDHGVGGKNSSMLIVGRGTHTNVPAGSYFGTTWTGP